MPGARPVNSYSPLASVSVVASTLPCRIEQIDLHAFEQDFGIVEIAVRVRACLNAAADRAGQQLAEVVVQRMIAVVEHRAGDAVDSSAAVPPWLPGRVLAVEPAGRLHFAHAVRAGQQVEELVEAERRRVGRRGGRDARSAIAVRVEQLERHAADAFFGRRSKMPSSLRS